MALQRYRVWNRRKGRTGPWTYITSYSSKPAANDAVKAYRKAGGYNWKIIDGPNKA